MAERLADRPGVLHRRRESAEHPFGSIKHWMGHGGFLMRRLENVRGEFSLTALAYNIRCFIRELLLTFSLSSTTCNSAWVSRGFSVIKHV